MPLEWGMMDYQSFQYSIGEHEMSKDTRLIKPRDLNIIKAFKNEIDLQTKIQQDKTKYKRKQKYTKTSVFDYDK